MNNGLDADRIGPGMSYYMAKLLGYLPFTFSNRAASLVYSSVMLSFQVWSGLYAFLYFLKLSDLGSSNKVMVKKVFLLDQLCRFLVNSISITIMVVKSREFFDLLQKFYRFDEYMLQARFQSHSWMQTLYVLYVMIIGLLQCLWGLKHWDLSYYIHIGWLMICLSTKLFVIQYTSYISILRKRYELANTIFVNSMLKNSSPDAGHMILYPKEINILFIQLRNLTEEVKAYFAYHTMLIIVESIVIFVACITVMTIHYFDQSLEVSIYHAYTIFQCSSRMLFLFIVVREAHNTVLETKKTVVICHQALNLTSDVMTTKYLATIVLNSWNHPIVFDVHDLIDLDYTLLQSIIASIVTYGVILVQIQLAILEGQSEKE